MIKVIGIAGFARCGKDTFVGIAKNILSKNGYTPVRIAFADSLKQEVDDMLILNNFSATVKTEDTEKKKLIRPLLVWWGCQRRNESPGGLYWINECERKINYFIDNWKGDPEKIVFLVSDVRFLNESQWIYNKYDGLVLHLKRFIVEDRKGGQDGSDSILTKVYDMAPNEEELKNDPMVQAIADHKIEWESKKKLTSEEAVSDPYLQKIVFNTLNSIKYFKIKTPVTGTLIQ